MLPGRRRECVQKGMSRWDGKAAGWGLDISQGSVSCDGDLGFIPRAW